MPRVSANRRFLVDDDGSPFFFLGDTGWAIVQRLDRAGKAFTVIQAVGISELEGLTVSNPYGDLPLVDLEPAKPNDASFRHVD